MYLYTHTHTHIQAVIAPSSPSEPVSVNGFPRPFDSLTVYLQQSVSALGNPQVE